MQAKRAKASKAEKTCVDGTKSLSSPSSDVQSIKNTVKEEEKR
jgi:hypothetical protein